MNPILGKAHIFAKASASCGVRTKLLERADAFFIWFPMTPQTDSARSWRLMAAAIVVGAILVSASIILSQSTRGTATVTQTVTQSVSVVSMSTTTSTSTSTALFGSGGAATSIGSNSSLGPELVLIVNPTSIKVGQSINAYVSLFNALPQTVSILPSKEWPFMGVPVALWPPCYTSGPASIKPFFDTPAYAVVLQGNYTAQELPSVANVTIAFSCHENASIDHIVLEPHSSQGYLTGSGFGPNPGPYTLSLNFTTSGSWDLLNSSRQLNPPVITPTESGGEQMPIPAPFSPGVYTIAVADEWGQEAVLHITVTSG
jgi:hypothetical protein